MTTATSKDDRPPKPGRLVIQYLQDNKRGATATEILRHLRSTLDNDVSELKRIVDSVLVTGTTLGFLERKGSYYMNWLARERCGQKRRKRRACSRRRRTGQRSCGKRRKRRRC